MAKEPEEESVEAFGLLFKQISLAYANNFQREAARYDLTSAQASILIYLDKADHPVNQRELETYFRLTNPTVTGLMQRMEAKGFIRREMNQADNRSKHIVLTPKALEISSEVRTNMYKVEEYLTKELRPEECSQLRSLLLRVLEIMCRCTEDEKHAE